MIRWVTMLDAAGAIIGVQEVLVPGQDLLFRPKPRTTVTHVRVAFDDGLVVQDPIRAIVTLGVDTLTFPSTVGLSS